MDYVKKTAEGFTLTQLSNVMGAIDAQPEWRGPSSIACAYYDGDQLMASNLVLSAASVFSPIGVQSSDDALNGFIKTVTPTVAKPLIELGLNENFFGGAIYSEQKGYAAKKSDAYLGSDRTWGWTNNLMRWLSEQTGGSPFRSGGIDIAPQSVEHMLKFMGGGVLQFALRLQSLGANVKSGETVERNDLPFVRRFYKQLYHKASIGEFYTAKDVLAGYKADLKLLSGQDRSDFIAKYKNELTLQAYASGVEKALQQLNKKKRAVEASQFSKAEKKSKIELIENKKVELSLRFSKKRLALGLVSLN
ncbi:LPD38 domain-containing protein [Shewanella surugensis]|uniref:Large polyvalent protein associated domain-containing protein n=1 Tax=Shewanella surugensis TaxID=212020 RepID=A0ABT0L755_9GAMM|nr:LPD38 domain-containing protein [Shewanella surugensis]MCL1123399.1 hypothetical protein [Shewanella surugensis]